MENKTAVMRNIQSQDLYRHIENDIYKNLRTGVSGTVEPDKAKEIFRLNVAASFFCNKNLLIEELILRLNLKIEQ